LLEASRIKNNMSRDRILYNGKLAIPEEVKLNLNNRAFRYGDGLFETMRMFEGKMPFLELHLERLQTGIDMLQLDLPIANHGIEYWQYEIRRIVKYYHQKYPKQAKNYRMRLTVFRNDGGYYTPSTNGASYILEVERLKTSMFDWNEKGLTIDIFRKVNLDKGRLNNLKTANGLPYVLASLFKKDKGVDDVLLLNNKERIVESTHSNVFFIKNNTLITPALGEGCTAGTTRKIILGIGKELGLKVKTTKCEINILKNVDEVFLSNAIRGIQWVRKFKKKRYEHRVSKAIYLKMNKLIDNSKIEI
jgi:branched-subunit amino acid aminotransferase/4-amino-4-deoxychorismate lyase